MMLESGPAASDRNYWLFVTVLCVGMALWFVYDGVYGYPSKNRAAAEKRYHSLVKAPLQLGETPTEEQLRHFLASGPKTVQALREQFGQPVYTQDEGGGTQIEHFPSLYGYVMAYTRAGQILYDDTGKQPRIAWNKWYKTKDEIDAQFYWALVPVLLGAYAVYRLVKAATLRVRIDQTGMTYSGKLIPFAAMRGLRDFSPKGWIDLYYDEAGRESKLRLDDHRVDKFKEIVEALCQVKQWENPIAQAAAAAAEPAAASPPETPQKNA